MIVESTTATLGIISYNLKDYGKSALTTRQQQHELLRLQRPDIVCLQEIWDDSRDLRQLNAHTATLAEALGMSAMPVPARRSHCHMAILWRPEYATLSQHHHALNLWHGLGVVQLDVGAAVALRVAVTHMAPWDPEQRLSDVHTVAGLLGDPSQATVIAGDWNSIGADPDYDPEPDWSRLRPDKIWRHVRWTDGTNADVQADRRPAQLLHRSGLRDAAAALQAPWQATGGHMGQDMPRRLDAFWTTRPQALRGYQVVDTPTARGLSDHLPIRIELSVDELDSKVVGSAAGQTRVDAPSEETTQ
jgi:endonuclease/exonuclease/phosphatase family metal-dependent hydrolase